MVSIGVIERDLPRTKDPDTVVCLVHGTIPSLLGIRLFSRIPWLEETSWFRKNLFQSDSEGIYYSPFYWSGENSHRGRAQAGVDLADHLRELRNRHPSSQHICVAHSHGGNVAAYACRRLQQSAARLPDRLITLGTPFFWVTRRNPEAVYNLLLGVSLGGALLWMLTFVLLKSRVLELPDYMSLVAVGMIMFCWAVLLLVALYCERLGKIAEKQYSTLSTTLKSGLNTLCICARRDEAKIYLELIETINQVCFGQWQVKICQYFSKLLFVVVFILCLRIIRGDFSLIGLFFFGPQDFGSSLIRAAFVVIICVLALVSAMGPIALLHITIGTGLLRSAPWGFGENFLLHWLLKIQIRGTPMTTDGEIMMDREHGQLTELRLSTPDSKPEVNPSRVDVIEWIYSTYSFQHSSMYTDPRVCKAIQDWMHG
jgi:hypothetical protein